MSALEKFLSDVHPAARVLSVETDIHEHRDTVCCDISGDWLVDDEALLDGSGIVEVDVARIVFTAPDQEPEPLLSDAGEEWMPISRQCLLEALEMARETAKSAPVNDATVSTRAKRITEIDEQIDDLALKGVA